MMRFAADMATVLKQKTFCHFFAGCDSRIDEGSAAYKCNTVSLQTAR